MPTSPIVDLSALKTTVTTAASTIGNLSGSITSAATDAMKAVSPSLGSLTNMLPTSVAGLQGAASNIGSTILGSSAAAIPSMTNVLKSLTPDMSALSGLAGQAVTELKSSVFSSDPIVGNIQAVQTEANSVATAVTAATDSIDQSNQNAPNITEQVITEIETVHKAMADYDAAMSAYVFDPINNTIPSVTTVLTALVIDQTLTKAQTEKDAAIDFSSGALTNVVYKIGSLSREAGVRYQRKSQLYAKAIDERSTASSDKIGDSAETVSYFRSTVPEQTDGQ